MRERERVDVLEGWRVFAFDVGRVVVDVLHLDEALLELVADVADAAYAQGAAHQRRGHHVFAAHIFFRQGHSLIGFTFTAALGGCQNRVLPPNILAIYEPFHRPIGELRCALKPFFTDNFMLCCHAMLLTLTREIENKIYSNH